MSVFAVRLGFVFAVAALCLGGRPVHAQSAPVTYWIPGWIGFGGHLDSGHGPNADGSDFASTRHNFGNGWFVDNQRSAMGPGMMGFGMTGLGLSGVNQAGTFGSFYSEGVQFGYNFKNAPVTFYGGLDTLKYNSGIGSAFSPFDSTTGTSGYRAHVGVEFKPASNLSLSLGLDYTEQSGRIDSNAKSPSLSNTSQFDLVGGRR